MQDRVNLHYSSGLRLPDISGETSIATEDFRIRCPGVEGLVSHRGQAGDDSAGGRDDLTRWLVVLVVPSPPGYKEARLGRVFEGREFQPASALIGRGDAESTFQGSS